MAKIMAKFTTFSFQKEKQSQVKFGQRKKQSQDLDFPEISNVFREMSMLQLTNNTFNNVDTQKSKG